MSISTFALFVALSLAIAILSAVLIIMPWLRPKKDTAADNQLITLNIDVYKSRLDELAADKQAGTIHAEHYQAQKTELERQLLDAKQPAAVMHKPSLASKLAIVIGGPIIAGLAYTFISDRSSVYELWQAQDSVGQVADDLLTGKINEPPEWALEDIAGLFSAMQTNVHHNAHDSERWMRLSNIFLSFEATESALESLARAYRLSPHNEEIAMAYAQMNFFVAEGMLDDSNRRVLLDVLKANPQQLEAQMLMVMGEARMGNYQQAQHWIAKMREVIAQKPGDQSAELADLDNLTANLQRQQAEAVQDVDITVTINPSLLPLIQADDVLFVAIRAAAGGPPYAAKRIAISELQQGAIFVTLSDRDAMMPERTLRSARASGEQLLVSARISHSGNATSQSGDLSANPVVLTDNQINIQINQQVP